MQYPAIHEGPGRQCYQERPRVVHSPRNSEWPVFAWENCFSVPSPCFGNHTVNYSIFLNYLTGLPNVPCCVARWILKCINFQDLTVMKEWYGGQCHRRLCTYGISLDPKPRHLKMRRDIKPRGGPLETMTKPRLRELSTTTT